MKKIILIMVMLYVHFFYACTNTNQSSEVNTNLPINPANFDTIVEGKKVNLVYIKNKNGYKAAITNYGARMVGIWLPQSKDSVVDILLGFNNIKNYITAEERYFGAIVGRYGNRIAKGKFTLNNKEYSLDINNGVNSLHGGRKGFHSVVWDMEVVDTQSVKLTYFSKNGEEGYPANFTVSVVYELTNENAIEMHYTYSADAITVANITNHNFWNLNGEGSGTINNHSLQVKAAKYTPVDETLIPTGIEPVLNTPFNFLKPTTIGSRLTDTSNIQLQYGKGYDHNFVLDKGITTTPQLVATIIGNTTNIAMDILTTEPGLQFYGGNFMQSKHILKSGATDDFRTAFCLETQHFPNSPNQLNFPSTTVEKNKIYNSTTIYKFYSIIK